MEWTNYIIQIMPDDLFQKIGTLASILSLIITISVWLSIRKIKKFYIFNARFPELSQQLSGLASKLSDSLNTFDGITTQIKKILVEMEIILKSLRKKTGSDVKKNISILIKEIQNIENCSDDDQKKLLEQIHMSTYKVIKECESLYEESRWER